MLVHELDEYSSPSVLRHDVECYMKIRRNYYKIVIEHDAED